jgi:hypothetical protein
MIILTNTTDKIQIVLGGNVTTNQLQWFSSYRDTTTTSITPGRSAGNTNNTTVVDLVGSPSSSTQRVVEYISVYNTDTTTSSVTILFYDNGTTYELIKVSLEYEDKLEYQSGVGFKTLDRFGSLKTSSIYESSNSQTSFNTTVLTSDVVNNNAVANTIADITGLSFPVTSGKTYYFRFAVTFTSAAVSTGARFSINGPTTTYLNYWSRWPNVSNSVIANIGQTTYDLPSATGTAAVSSSPNIGVVAEVEGIIIPSADGTVIGRFASEVSSSAITAKIGSVVYYKQLD